MEIAYSEMYLSCLGPREATTCRYHLRAPAYTLPCLPCVLLMFSVLAKAFLVSTIDSISPPPSEALTFLPEGVVLGCGYFARAPNKK